MRGVIVALAFIALLAFAVAQDADTIAREERKIEAALKASYAAAGCPAGNTVCRRMTRDACHSLEDDYQGLKHCLPAIAALTKENTAAVKAWKWNKLSRTQQRTRKTSAAVKKARAAWCRASATWPT